MQTPEELRSKNARAVVRQGGKGGSGPDAGSSGEGAGGGEGGESFPTISELTAERIRRAAQKHAPDLSFTELTVTELTVSG